MNAKEFLEKYADKNGFLDLRGTDITALPKGLTVGGFLDLRGTGVTTLPKGLTVGDNLYLQGTDITALPEGLTVGGNLYLQGTGVTTLPEGLTVGDSLYLEGTGITALPKGLTVGGYLDLENTKITALPEGLTVGGFLDLRGTRITALPEGLTVGGNLHLENTKITTLPDTLTVGGSLYLQGTGVTNTSKVNTHFDQSVLNWLDKKYIKRDGIFTEVISHKGNVYRVREIAQKKVTYLVTDGHGKWSHGDTLDEARKDLIYKLGKRDKSEFEHLSMDSVLPLEDAITAYRCITGACSAGVRGFVEGLPEVKQEYSIAEICELTANAYGGQAFKTFFA